MSPDPARLTRQEVVSAFAAAAGQRVVALSGDGPEELAKLRKHLFARGRKVEDQSAVEDRVSGFIPSLVARGSQRVRDEKVPPAVMGRRMAMAGSTGSGDDWQPGDGARALRKLLDNDPDPSIFPDEALRRIRAHVGLD